MYETIDQIQAGLAPFRSYWLKYNGPMLPTPPKWMMQEYELYAHDPPLVLQQQLATPKFSNKFDPIPYHRFNSTGDQVFSNLMSGDWAWDQAVTYSILSSRRYMAEHHVESDIRGSEHTHVMFLPLIMGSDKTTIAIVTGNQEFHPFYGSPGVISNITHRSHGSRVLPYAMLPIPKGLSPPASDK